MITDTSSAGRRLMYMPGHACGPWTPSSDLAIRRRGANPAHDVIYFEYSRRVVSLADLGEFEFLLTDPDLLTDAKSDRRAVYRAMPRPHSVPDCEYIRIRHF